MTLPLPIYLDWWEFFVNQVAGGVYLFLFLAIILTAYLSAKFRFPNMLFFGIILVFLTIMSFFIPVLIFIVIFTVGILWAWVLIKTIRAG